MPSSSSGLDNVCLEGILMNGSTLSVLGKNYLYPGISYLVSTDLLSESPTITSMTTLSLTEMSTVAQVINL